MAQTTLPPLDVLGPDGDRLTLRALDRADTVAGLAERLGTDRLWTTGRELRPTERLADVDELRVGSRLDAHPDAPSAGPDRSERDSQPVVEVAVVTGPATTTWMPLPAGRHLVGRAAHARIRLDDPGVEIHHAVLSVAPDASMVMLQLSGHVPIRIDGRTLDSEPGIGLDDRVTVGSSILRFRRPVATPIHDVTGAIEQQIGAREPTGTVAAHPTDPWRRIVWRAPYRTPDWSPATVTAPVAPKEPTRPTLTGLIGVAVTAMGAVVIARVMGNAMFMLFAAMGLIASATTFAVGTISARRRRATMRAEHERHVERFGSDVEGLHSARRRHHSATNRSVIETLDEALGDGSRLWQRRLESGEVVLRAVVGTGTHRWRPDIDVPDPAALDVTLLQRVEACRRLVGVDAPIGVRPGDAIALHGATASARSIARAVIVQLATWIGPADWQLVVVSNDRAAWRWVDWLPHGALDGAALVVADPSDGLGDLLDAVDAERPTVLVTDEPHLFTARTGPLRRFVTATNAASIVVVDTDATVPAMCRRLLTIGSTGSATWTGDVPDEDDCVAIEFAGISISTADLVARRLACLVDPEDGGGSSGGVPPAVSFGELLAPSLTTADVIAQRWRDGGADPAPCAPLGVSADGRIDLDLVRDGPHGLIAGTTGAGKSELLRTLVLSLAASVGPQHLNFVLVDYKGGSTFDACTALPHTVGLVTDLDDGLAERALVSLDAELHRRERMLRTVGASDLTDYRTRRGADGAALDPIARLVVVIDEFAALAKELPDFLDALVGIAQRGRSLGVHLLLATQRPAGVVNDDIRANTNLRLALRLHDRSDALDVVGDELPATFPRGRPGRAALRLGPDELVVFQAARCTGMSIADGDGGLIVERAVGHGGGVERLEYVAQDRGALDDVDSRGDVDHDDVDHDDGVASDGGAASAGEAQERSELEVVADAIVDAAAIDGVDAPHRPWLEPLPFPLAGGDGPDEWQVDGADPAAIGVIDDPARQARIPLVWRPADGSLALVGSIGAGTTWTMISVATAVCRSTPAERLHLYVIDARGDDGLTALSSLAHCGGVVRSTEDERLHRLLQRVADVIDERLADGGGEGPDVVVMIDGYGSLRTSLGAVERQATFDLLQRLVNDGPAAGVTTVIADDASSALTMAPIANRWIFHLDDPSAARGLGLRTAPVPHATPGRLRILACGREAQVAQGAAGLAEIPARGETDGGPEPIRILPDVVEESQLREYAFAIHLRDGAASLPVGVSSTDLGLASLEVVDGDHVLIVGSPRAGVSTALARCVAAWETDARRRRSPFEVVRLSRRTPLDAGSIADPDVRVCIAADDAHRIDDALLVSIAKGEHPHVTIIAGGRADAIRGSYGHWTREVAKARCGIVMSSRSDPDGDLLGAQIPRRSLVPARPGLAWLVDGGPLRLAQIATP